MLQGCCTLLYVVFVALLTSYLFACSQAMLAQQDIVSDGIHLCVCVSVSME